MTEIDIIKEKIKPIAQKYNLVYVWLFGSYAKNTQTENSDIDIIVRTEDVLGGFKIVEVKLAIEEAFQRPVDIVTTGSIKDSLLEDEILDEILIYSAAERNIAPHNMPESDALGTEQKASPTCLFDKYS